jgi:alpha-L-arabinofuranosidase
MNRRRFVATSFAALTARKGFTQNAQDQSIAIHPDTRIGTIRPELHGHFAEHLGSCIYGGLWTGTGYRQEAIRYLKELGIPVLRWPGGCFADDYHWRDGIGPAAKRPKTVNLHWGQYVEDNSFGTHEFIQLCRLIGAEPYLAGNVGSGTPEELRNWVEYCNFPGGSALSDERVANGAAEPFKVRYWGVGNENWGCGGRMTPEEYAGYYRQFSTYISARGGFGGVRNFLIACGPNRNDTDWSRRFLTSVGRSLRGVGGFAMHFYQNGRAPATKFTVDALREQIALFADMEKGIVQQHALLRSFDPEGNAGLMVDEWGVWDRIQPEDVKRYGALWQQITMRSAVGAALGLNAFHRHADKLVMCNIAQIVNVLHSLLLTDGPRCVRTTTYYAHELLKPHRGRMAVSVENSAATDPHGLSVSASTQDRAMSITLVNPRHDIPMLVKAAVSRGNLSSASARILTHPDFNACNTFEAPDTIVPRNHTVERSGGGFTISLPPMSVATVEATLA